MELLWGTIAPIGAGPPTKGTGSPAQVAVRAYGGRAGDCSYQTARANRLEGMGSPAHAAVGAYGAFAGDSSSHRRVPTNGGDGESYRGGG